MSKDTLATWFNQHYLGRYVAKAEQRFINNQIADNQGGHVVQTALPEWAKKEICCADRDAIFYLSALPFASNSVSCLITPHGLTNDNLVDELTEIYRVLEPGGRLVLTAWNKQSLWQLCKNQKYSQFLPNDLHNALLPTEMKKRLEALGLNVLFGQFMVYTPPINNSVWLNRLKFLEKAGDRWWPHWAAVYGLVAIKEVVGVHPLPELKKQMPSENIILGAACRK